MSSSPLYRLNRSSLVKPVSSSPASRAVFTANDVGAVSAPLRDRCRVIMADAPTDAQIAGYVRARLSDQDPQVIRAAADAVAGKSMRLATRVVDAVIAAGRRQLLN